MTLSIDHMKQLRLSAISPEVTRARGYETVTSPERLMKLGFSQTQARLKERHDPGLLIPIYDLNGVKRCHVLRPDIPRWSTKDRKSVKYEWPWHLRKVPSLDVPPGVLHKVMDSRCPLYVTEGVKKADAGASSGLAVIDFGGVWNWQTKACIAELKQIPLCGREVVLAFDNDQKPETKAHVGQALGRLAYFLRAHGAHVSMVEFPCLSGAKGALDDFLASGGDLAELVLLEPPLEPWTWMPYGAPSPILPSLLDEARKRKVPKDTQQLLKQPWIAKKAKPRSIEAKVLCILHNPSFGYSDAEIDRLWAASPLGSQTTAEYRRDRLKDLFYEHPPAAPAARTKRKNRVAEVKPMVLSVEPMQKQWMATKEVCQALPSLPAKQVQRALIALAQEGVIRRDPPIRVKAERKTVRWKA